MEMSREKSVVSSRVYEVNGAHQPIGGSTSLLLNGHQQEFYFLIFIRLIFVWDKFYPLRTAVVAERQNLHIVTERSWVPAG